MNLGLNRPGCGISDSVQSWMDQIQHSGEKDPVAADSKGDEQEEKDSNKNDDKGELTEKCNHIQILALPQTRSKTTIRNCNNLY